MKNSLPINQVELESTEKSECLLQAIQSACSRIAPLWPLKHFVAVNPFAGLTALPFAEVVQLIRSVAHADMLPAASLYQEALQQGEISNQDLAAAIALHGKGWTLEALQAALHAPALADAPRYYTVADAVDHASGSKWNTLIVEEVSKWCAAYFDEGQALWPMPWKSLPLFRAWKRGAAQDRTLEVSGLTGVRTSFEQLPDDASLAIEKILATIGLPEAQWENWLHRQLMSIRGWAGYVQYRAREVQMRGGIDQSLVELLAIRLAYDFAVHQAHGIPSGFKLAPAVPLDTKVPALVVWQDALEIANQRKLIAKLSAGIQAGQANSPTSRPAFQAVFCIDVRSEVYRRALETAEPKAETIGFAGFFGFPIEAVALAEENGTSRCPVLILPTHRVKELAPGNSPAAGCACEQKVKEEKFFASVWKSFKTASVSCFPFVEALGLSYASSLLGESLTKKESARNKPHGYRIDDCIPAADKVTLATGALRNMGLTRNFARLVLICGHGSQTRNNPFGTSLDCGACGGHAGDANARIAAAVLNDAAVRKELAGAGIEIPADTHFVAGLHNTTTDAVELFDLDGIPATHAEDLHQLKRALDAAGTTAREERKGSLGEASSHESLLKAAIENRAKDWSQVRPEWGLAGNYAFIAAPRARTRSLQLDGRAFLHNYDPALDTESKTLELILCAPMVVANWINLQYFGSSANNELFGSGNKVLHNVVGKIGVLEGNGGDLRTGLPWQSVHTGEKLAHLPLRLNVFIEAEQAQIDAILAKHEGVRQLVENGWLHLHSIHPQRGVIERRQAGGIWSRVNPGAVAA